MQQLRGYLFTIIASIGFGIQPLLAKFCYALGVGPLMLAFWSVALMVPIFFVLALFSKTHTLKIRPIQLPKTAFLALTGAVLTTSMLFSSFNYIDTGTATALNFSYPVFVMLISVLIYKDAVGRSSGISLALCVLDILMFVNPNGEISARGFLLALGSGLTYGVYMIYLDKSGLLETMGFYNFTFWFFLFSALMLAPIAALNGEFTLPDKPAGFIYILLFTLDGGMLATVFLQAGIRKIGGRKASIISALEPVTSLILGAVFFNESVGVAKALGMALIIAAVSILMLNKRDRKAA